MAGMAEQQGRRGLQSPALEALVTKWPVRRSRPGRLTFRKIMQVIQLFFVL